MRVAVGIVVYCNGVDELSRCLRSVVRQESASAISLLAVGDNGDGSGAATISEALERSGASTFPSLLLSGPNVGFGAGHNRLMRAVFSGQDAPDAYLCLNPDSLLHPDCIGRMAAFAEARGRNALFEAMQFPVPHPKIYDATGGSTAWCSGCCLLIPRQVFETVGGFDERFFMFCEDVDLSWQVKARGGGCYAVPGAFVQHYVHDRLIGDNQRDMLALFSAYQLARKWRGERFAEIMAQDLKERWGITLDEEEGGDVVAALDAVRARVDFAHGMNFSPAFW